MYAIKVVQTYNQELLEHKNYTNHLTTALVAGKKSDFFKSISYAFFYACTMFFYGWAFYWAGYLRWNEVKDINGNEFNGGTCITIIFCMLFGTMGFTTAGPNIGALAEGRVAGTLAFGVIDHEPEIKANDPNAKTLKSEDVKGEIRFENVSFRYPSNPDVKVLKNFNCTFKAGTTNALVGPSGSGKSTIIQMLERFYDPLSGTIYLDGEDTKSLNLRSMRQIIGYVS